MFSHKPFFFFFDPSWRSQTLKIKPKRYTVIQNRSSRFSREKTQTLQNTTENASPNDPPKRRESTQNTKKRTLEKQQKNRAKTLHKKTCLSNGTGSALKREGLQRHGLKAAHVLDAASKSNSGLLVDWLAGLLVGLLACWLAGWVTRWLGCWLACWLAWALLGSMGSPGISWTLLGSPCLSWALLGSPGLPALPGLNGLSWALPGSPGLSWASWAP